MQARAEEDEDDDAIRKRRQADGTPVTPETFAAWKVNSHIGSIDTRALRMDRNTTMLTLIFFPYRIAYNSIYPYEHMAESL